MTPLRLVLVGGTGFVGGALLRRLAALPPGTVAVRALVRPAAGGAPRLGGLPFVEEVAGALPDALPDALFFDEPFVLVHLGTKQIDRDGSGFEGVNVRGTERLLEAAATRPGCLGVIYGSSASVYGQGPHRGTTEGAPQRPRTELARSRAAAEATVLRAMEARGGAALLLRPRFVLGRGDRFTLPGLLQMVGRGMQVGGGRQAFTVIDVDDYGEAIARLSRRMAERAEQGQAAREALNVGYAQPVTMREVVEALCRAFEIEAPRRRVPAWRPVPWVLRRLPSRGADALATRLELVGRDQRLDTAALAREAGADLTARDPREALDHAAALLAAGPRPDESGAATRGPEPGEERT